MLRASGTTETVVTFVHLLLLLQRLKTMEEHQTCQRASHPVSVLGFARLQTLSGN